MSWQDAVAYALTKAAVNHVAAIVAANRSIVDTAHPSKVTRIVDGNPNAPDDEIKLVSKVTFQYVYLIEIVAVALLLLREKSPVGAHDKHPGLYRDSHMVFLNGIRTDDVSNWQPGEVIHISNPLPYSRKIESGRLKMSVPGHVYEDTAQILASRYGNSASIKFVYMPVRLGSNEVSAAAKRSARPSSSRNVLKQQPALQIEAR